MLRRTEAIATESEPQAAESLELDIEQIVPIVPEQAAPVKAEIAMPPRTVEPARSRAPDTGAPDGSERRRHERVSVKEMRSEFQRTKAPDSRPSKPPRPSMMRAPSVPRGWAMKRSRLVLLAVALAAGGLAAYLALQRDQQPAAEPVTQIVQEARTRILVAKNPIGIGERLSPASIEWQDWPEGAVRPEYVTIAADPEALNEMSGAVARFEIAPGEPIRDQKLVHTDQGYLSAVLDPGMRGVSVAVAQEAASGGFIVPNDHVDVIMTRATPLGQMSTTILQNARVLAINSRLGETGKTGGDPNAEESEDPKTQVFQKSAIATLALDPEQAEVIINGASMGDLSLVLRSISDFAEVADIDRRPTNQAIRVASPFWLK